MQDRRTFLKGALLAPIIMPTTQDPANDAGKSAHDRPRVEVSGDWQVRVEPGTWTVGKTAVRVAHPVTLEVAQPDFIWVTDEKYDGLPLFDPNAAPWLRGAKLRQLATFETTAPDMLLPESLILKAGPGDATA